MEITERAKELHTFLSDVFVSNTQLSGYWDILEIWERVPDTLYLEKLLNHCDKNYKDLFLTMGVNNKEYSFDSYGNVKRSVKDSDIIGRKHFILDFDIYAELFGKDTVSYTVAQYDEYTEARDQIVNLLDSHYLYSSYSYIIESGGGIHVYYISPSVVTFEPDSSDVNAWKAACGYHFRGIDNLCADVVGVDHSLKNTGRIIRCPMTINHKREKKVRVNVYKRVDRTSELVSKMLVLGRTLIRGKPVYNNSFKGIHKTGNKFIDTVNEIPIPEIVFKAWGWRQDGISAHFKDPNDASKCHTGCFWNKDINKLISNGTSRLTINEGGRSSFDFIRYELRRRDIGFRDAALWAIKTFPSVKRCISTNTKKSSD